MEVTPRLITVSQPRSAEGAVLLLHGGASRRGSPMVSPTQLSVLRMIPIARRMARASRRRLAVYRLLNSHRGWDANHTPVDDAHWALEEISRRLGPEVSIGLIGHSLGGRAAILGSSHSSVTSVVALNPWVYPHDGNGTFINTRFLVVHGDADRIADPARSAMVARAIAKTAPVTYVSVLGGKHAMLRRHDVFSELAVDFTKSALLGPAGPGRAELYGGEPWIEV